MKFKSATLNVRETTTVTLRLNSTLDLTLKVGALPMGISRRYKLVFPMPRPPYTETMKAGSSKPERTENWDDPVFAANFENWKDLEKIFLFCVVVAVDDNVKFESITQGNIPANENELKNVRAELEEAGFTDFDIAHVLDASARISRVDDEAITAARSNF